ncbi:MAG: DSD1 family PLP-dependent enzyme [Pseudomonadales bacterium]
MEPARLALQAAVAHVVARPWKPVLLEQPVPVAQVPTPALLLDVAAFERNLARMADFLGQRGKGFRPHAKTHKCPLIAARQLEIGAVGVCAAKLSEAVVLVHAGVGRVLLTSPLVGAAKAGLLVELARTAEQLDVVVDGPAGLAALSEAASADASVGVVVDVDVAMGRTGTRSLDQVLQLADAAANAPGLRFRGVQHYAGHLMHVKGHARRREKSLRLWEAVSAMVTALADRGLAPEIVTGGGTGSYDIDCEVAAITDLQVGSYIFMDQEYRLIGGRDGDWFDDFEVSLQVATTAISKPLEGAITVDGGYKAFASDSVNPQPMDLPGAEYHFAGDEHGVLRLREGNQEPLLGSVQRFITPHCDPTVNLYDFYWVCRDGMVTELWPVAARGCSW